MPTRSGLRSWTVRYFSLPSDGNYAKCYIGIETAAFKDQPQDEIDRLMHMVVVGGGPTGVEYAGELHDFLIVSTKFKNHAYGSIPNFLYPG